ncbi:MAG: site-2 protease family protein, partial [Shewanella sp.]
MISVGYIKHLTKLREHFVELLRIDCLGKELRLEGSMAGWQQLFWADTLVSVKQASADTERLKVHEFELATHVNPVNNTLETDIEQAAANQAIKISLEVGITWQPFSLDYRLIKDEKLIDTGTRNTKDIERQVPVKPIEAQRKLSLIGLGSLGFKLLKSVKVIKVVLAGASVAAYSWLFSFQFALALIACLVFHEYGHIRAMKYFGMKTKGIYLIPFMGGLALSDEKINTRWQDV